MNNKLAIITEGLYVLEEIERFKKFKFYRQDGGVLEGLKLEPKEMYKNYIETKIMEGENISFDPNSINYSITDDIKVLTLSIQKLGEKPKEEASLIQRAKEFVFKLF